MTVTSLFATFNAFLPADKENKERANSFLKYTNTFTFTVAGCLLLYNGILKENQSYQLVAVVIFAVGLVMTIKWWLKPIT